MIVTVDAQAIPTAVPAEFTEAVAQSAASCPERAIHLKEES
ncbi:hypothetical protein V4U86_15665 [Mycobacterium sp. AMU20-3851]